MSDLVFSATARCLCGAGLARTSPDEPWLCSATLAGTSDKAIRHGYAAGPGVASELHPSANGRNTRPLAEVIPLRSA